MYRKNIFNADTVHFSALMRTRRKAKQAVKPRRRKHPPFRCERVIGIRVIRMLPGISHDPKVLTIYDN